MCQNTFFLFNSLSIAFANFLSHKQPNEHPLGCLSHHSARNTCHIIRGIYIFLHGIFTKVVTEPSPLGEHHPRCSMTPTTNKTIEKQNILPMELYNLARCSIYNDHLAEKQTNMTPNNITTWHPYLLLELYNTTRGDIYIHIHMYIYQKHHTKTYTKKNHSTSE